MGVYYLDYRPRKIDDLDLGEVRQNLKKIFRSEDPPRAFLFTGPKGSGKTSAARVIAKAFNCLNYKDDVCGECQNCKTIETNQSVDFLELDAASNRRIDDIRELKDKLFLSPSVLKKKVIVLDEAHMLTSEAFNALLKMLEETPEHVAFVLCTTDSQKIPETILSRLIRIDFRKASLDEIRQSIEKVVEGEGLKVGDGVVEMIYKNCEGSFRNAHRTLTELTLRYGSEVGIEEASTFFGNKFGDYQVEMLYEDVENSRVVEVMDHLEKMAEAGVDFSGFRNRLVEYGQKLLIDLIRGGRDVGWWDKQRLSEFLKILINCGKMEKDTEISQLPLEIGVVDFCDRYKPNKEETKQPKSVGAAVLKPNSQNEVQYCLNLEEVNGCWEKVINKVEIGNRYLGGLLKSAMISDVDKNRVILTVPFKFFKDKLEEDKNRRAIEMAFGDEVRAEVIIGCSVGKVEKKVDAKPLDDDKAFDVAKEIFG